jgi:hypothetical protein
VIMGIIIIALLGIVTIVGGFALGRALAKHFYRVYAASFEQALHGNSTEKQMPALRKAVPWKPWNDPKLAHLPNAIREEMFAHATAPMKLRPF